MQSVAHRSRMGSRIAPAPRIARHARANRAVAVVCQKATLQFVKGVDESCIPLVKLTRSRTGVSGKATFVFENPDVFSAAAPLGDITGLYMIDDEGVLSTVDVTAKFVNGKPKAIEAQYAMRSSFEWDRFMRFMDRYAASNGLGFSKAGA